MKIILSLLGSISLTASTSSLVISCSNKMPNFIKINGSFFSTNEEDFMEIIINTSSILYTEKIPKNNGGHIINGSDPQWPYAILWLKYASITATNTQDDNKEPIFVSYIYINESSFITISKLI